jgi:hypothetical protein
MPTLLIVMVFGLVLDKIYPTTGLLPFIVKVVLMVVLYLLLIYKFTMNAYEKEIIGFFINKFFNFIYRFKGKTDIHLNVPTINNFLSKGGN